MYLTNRIFNDDIFKFLDDSFFYTSPVRDMNPVTYYKKDKDYIAEFKTLGINSSDVNVKLEDDKLTVSGETKNEFNDKSFSTNITISLDRKVVNEIESIDYKSQNGLTYVFLRMKESQSSKIKINKI